MVANFTEVREPGRAIVVLPARGGSKRFGRKNIALLNGRPLLAYPILASLKAETIDDVYVSTEDSEIASIAVEFGATVPFVRPRELAGDEVTADPVVRHLLRHLIRKSEDKIDIVVLIQPTSPFVLPEHIDSAVQKLRTDARLDSVTTMCEVDHRHHPYNLATTNVDGSWDFIFHDERRLASTRQSKPLTYKFGNLFAMRPQTILNEDRFGQLKGSILIDPLYSWDVDFSWELSVAENLIQNQVVRLPHIGS